MGNTKHSVCIIEWSVGAIGYLQYYPHDNVDKKKFELDEKEITYGIDLFIGEVNEWSRGVGPRVLEQMIRHIFETTKAEKIMIDPLAKNKRAIRCYE